MPLPETFPFSQASLQDYVDCPRRFQLRYVLMQPWPELVTGSPGEFEQHAQRGAAFHRLAQQHTLGLDPDRLAMTIHDETLARWWQTYLAHLPPDLPAAVRRAEVVVSAPLTHPPQGEGAGGERASHRLVAKFDLLAAEPGERLTVVDWKTVLKRPRRTTLARRLQTRVYRYLAVEAGASFYGGQRPPRNGMGGETPPLHFGAPQPEQVEMVYWFAEFGGAVERFPYDARQHAADRDYLAGLAAEIDARREPTWPLTPDERQCRFCNYRSLCERNVRPGFLADLEEDLEPSEPEIDLEQVAEIEF